MFSRAPPRPESLAHTIAKRLSAMPATSAHLPPREWPTTITFLASSSGVRSIQSITLLAPHAQAERTPQSDGFRSAYFGPKALKTPLVSAVSDL